ncbi:MAG TPA: trehalose-phosphatase [Candidatus Acidoferrales bacterium]|nr:trehalose-phosphatase [Candidatus Acidoferrales bacterium]
MQPCRRTKHPAPLPEGLLSELAAKRGLGLFLDYDGTLAEIVTDPSRATPVAGVRDTIDRLNDSGEKIAIAIVTGRRIDEVKTLLGLKSEATYSGVHGMELSDRAGKTEFTAAAVACAPAVARVREWLERIVPRGRGFRIEDKAVAIGLHFREADPDESRALCAQFSEFVARETPDLKVLQLKMLVEAMPLAAGKGHAIASLRTRLPRNFVAVYFGDDTTDEDAFAALGAEDLGILVGPERASLARYRVADPRAVARELKSLAAAATGARRTREIGS